MRRRRRPARGSRWPRSTPPGVRTPIPRCVGSSSSASPMPSSSNASTFGCCTSNSADLPDSSISECVRSDSGRRSCRRRTGRARPASPPWPSSSWRLPSPSARAASRAVLLQACEVLARDRVRRVALQRLLVRGNRTGDVVELGQRLAQAVGRLDVVGLLIEERAVLFRRAVPAAVQRVGDRGLDALLPRRSLKLDHLPDLSRCCRVVQQLPWRALPCFSWRRMVFPLERTAP